MIMWRPSRVDVGLMSTKDHLGDWSPEKDCCYRLTFRQPVRKPWLPHRLSKRQSITTSVLPKEEVRDNS